MKRATTIILFGVLFLTAVCNVNAGVTFGDGGVALQGILDTVTVDPLGNSSIDVLADAMEDMDDSYWTISASGSSIATLVIELAAVQQSGNKFGIFDIGDMSNKIQLFDGSEFYGTKVVTILDDFTVLINYGTAGMGNFSSNGFGYYLETGVGTVWYSDTTLNVDGLDHMVAYQGNDSDIVKLGNFAPGIFQSNEYILAFEDQRITPPNYDDFVVLVESVTPMVPEPATMILLGLGSLLLRKRRAV